MYWLKHSKTQKLARVAVLVSFEHEEEKKGGMVLII